MRKGEEGLVVGIGMTVREKMVSGSAGQLSVVLSKTITLLGITVVLVCWKDKNVGVGPGIVEGLALKKGSVAIDGEGFGEVGLRDSGEDVSDKFQEGGKRGALEGQTGWVHGIGHDWEECDWNDVEDWGVGSEVLLAEDASEVGNISNQAEVIRQGFRGEGENRGLRGDERRG